MNQILKVARAQTLSKVHSRHVRRIVVAMLGSNEHLGDNIMKSSVLLPLRENFPKAQIIVVAKFPSVFENNPHINTVINGQSLQSDEKALSLTIALRPDLVLDMCTYPDFYFMHNLAELASRNIEVVSLNHQITRDVLRRAYNIAPPPFTDGDIPILMPKVDEFVMSMSYLGMKIHERSFPQIFTTPSEYKKVVKKLEAEGLDLAHPTYILCPNASRKNREWGVKNFHKLAKILAARNCQVIVCDVKRATKVNQESQKYEGKVFYIATTQREFFAMLGLNSHLDRRYIAGIVALDSGSLHAAAATNQTSERYRKPHIVCLGHDQVSGDLRYADPGTHYVARLSARCNKGLVELAKKKQKAVSKKDLKSLLPIESHFRSIDEPMDSKYIVRMISDDRGSVPIYLGDQVYTHTLLRNPFRNARIELTKDERIKFYRRKSAKSIEPEFINSLLSHLEQRKSLNIVRIPKKDCVYSRADDQAKVTRLGNDYTALIHLGQSSISKIPKPIYFHQDDHSHAVLVNHRLKGLRLSFVWERSSKAYKRRMLSGMLHQLHDIHKIKSKSFGKVGYGSSYLVDSWEEYILTTIKQRLEHLSKNNLMSQLLVRETSKFVDANISVLETTSSSLIHHDAKIDNWLVNERGVKGLIDFEYATLGALDYEADTILRAFSDPFVYFGYGHDRLKKDYGLVVQSIRSLYPSLLLHKEQEKRLALYNLKFYLDLICMRKNEEHCKQQLSKIVSP